MARQKRRGAPDLPVNQEEKPGSRILKTETGKQAKVAERAQVTTLFLWRSGWGWGEEGSDLVRVRWEQVPLCSQRSCMNITEMPCLP